MDILAHPREVDPGVLLIEEIERTAGVIDWLERKIGGLEEEGEFIGNVETVTRESGMGAQGNLVDTTKVESKKEVTHWWKLLEAERRHLVQATATAIRSGIEERKVRLAERSISALEATIAAILMDFGLDPHSEKVRTVVGARLRESLENGLGVPGGPGEQRYVSPAIVHDLVSAYPVLPGEKQRRTIDGETASVPPIDF